MYSELLMVEGTQARVRVRDCDKDDDGNRNGVFCQPETDIAVKQRAPGFCSREEDGEKTGPRGADDGIQKGSIRHGGARALQFERGLVKVNDAVEERKDVGGKVCHVAHGVVVGVEDGEEVVHPGGVDQGPGHEWEKGDAAKRGFAQMVEVFGEDGKGAGDAEDGEWLGGESGMVVSQERKISMYRDRNRARDAETERQRDRET